MHLRMLMGCLAQEWINKEDDVNWNDKMNSLVLIFPGNDEDNDPEGEENIAVLLWCPSQW